MKDNRNHIMNEVRPGVWHIDEFGLDAIYYIEGKERGLLIDTGTGVADLKGLIEEKFHLPYDVVITHGHVDHAGGIGQFDEVHIHPLDNEMALGITTDARKGYAQSLLDTYPDMKPAFEVGDITEREKDPRLVPLKEGQKFDLGGKTLEIFELPGHTEGSVCLLDREDKILFSGDNLQPILLLVMEGEDRNEVIRKWFKGVEKAKSYRSEFDLMYGGHGFVDISTIDDLEVCGNGILNGTIKAEKTKVHIFDAPFAHYGNVFVTYVSREELFAD